MTPTDYAKILEDSKKELEDLLIRQEDIERRIARLKQAILALTPLVDEEGKEHGLFGADVEPMLDAMGIGGITQAIREILKAATAPMTPVEIKQGLMAMGVGLRGYKNVMASIHSTLKRLAANDEIATKDNGLTYQWKWHSEIRRLGRLSDMK